MAKSKDMKKEVKKKPEKSLKEKREEKKDEESLVKKPSRRMQAFPSCLLFTCKYLK